MLQNDESLYEKAVPQVMAGSALPGYMVQSIVQTFQGARLGHREQTAALKDVFGGEDFDWPWFDDWLATFQEERKWPSFSAWWWFKGEFKPIKTVKAVLERMTVASIKALAREKAVQFDGNLKADELRSAISRKLRWGDVETLADQMNEEDAAKYSQFLYSKKLEILSNSINYRVNALRRHEQISALLDYQVQGRTALIFKPKIRPDDNSTSRRLAKGYVFDPSDTESLPPFFPGDRSTLETSNSWRK